jgi:hypothetical protein
MAATTILKSESRSNDRATPLDVAAPLHILGAAMIMVTAQTVRKEHEGAQSYDMVALVLAALLLAVTVVHANRPYRLNRLVFTSITSCTVSLLQRSDQTAS